MRKSVERFEYTDCVLEIVSISDLMRDVKESYSHRASAAVLFARCRYYDGLLTVAMEGQLDS